MTPDVLKIIKEMEATFKDRRGIYKSNYIQLGNVMEALFPDGVQIKGADAHNRWHLFLMMVVKITRLANTDIKHKDSVHDCAVYAAMLEAVLEMEEK